MNISVVSTKSLSDGSERFLICVSAAELIYLGYILESFEGLCNYTTPKKGEPILQVDVTSDYIQDFNLVIQALQEWNYEES